MRLLWVLIPYEHFTQQTFDLQLRQIKFTPLIQLQNNHGNARSECAQKMAAWETKEIGFCAIESSIFSRNSWKRYQPRPSLSALGEGLRWEPSANVFGPRIDVIAKKSIRLKRPEGTWLRVCRLTCAVRRVRRLVPYFAGRAVADGIGVWFSWLIAHYRTKGWTKRWWSRRSKEESLSCFRKSWSRFCLQSCDLCMTVVFLLVRKLFI